MEEHHGEEDGEEIGEDNKDGEDTLEFGVETDGWHHNNKFQQNNNNSKFKKEKNQELLLNLFNNQTHILIQLCY